VNEDALRKGVNSIDKFLSRSVEKERLTPNDKEATLQRINPTTEVAAVASCDLVIEAVKEDMEVKANVFKALDTHAKEHVILASNTSSLPITEIAAVTNRPEKVIGMHFMNPVPIM